MKLGIISDTHGSVAAWNEALAGPFKDVELILHTGDVLYHGPRNPIPAGHGPASLAQAINASPVPVVVTAGNCDAPIDQDLLEVPLHRPYAFLALGDLRLFAAHETETRADLRETGRRLGANLLVGGHTHVPSLKIQEDGSLFLNPGSPALPKGPEPEPTVAVVQGATVRIIRLSDGAVLCEETISM